MKVNFTKSWYKPREIARLGYIKNNKQSDNENSNYEFILKLIKGHKLQARNFSLGAKPMWLVSKDEIKRYMKEWE